MPRATLDQIKAKAIAYADSSLIANETFTATKNNLVGLLDKIGKVFHIEQSLQDDKLAMFDGDYMEFGKTIEEWQRDMYPVQDYDATGANALSPFFPEYRPVAYSYTLGRKKIPVSIKNDDVERAVNNAQEFGEVVADQYKGIEDTYVQFRYAVKRQMIADYIAKAVAVRTSTTNFATTGTYSLGATVLVSGAPYLVFKNYTNGDATSADDAIAKGYLVKLNLIEEIAKPVDSSTGEAFIEQLKKDVEIASDSSSGNSLNGNALGSSQQGLVLVVKQGIMPTLDVKTMAGAFHLDKVAIPTEVVVVKDFGNASSDYYAVLLDRRGMRLHPTYNATRENLNGDGDWLNLFRHTENTAFLSRNSYFKAYKVPAGA